MIGHELPMGWKELPPVGNPLDEGTSEDLWHETAKPRHPRTEVKLWFRGGRYVRICQVTVLERCGKKAHPWVVHAGWLDCPDLDEWVLASDKETVVKKAFELMRIGGYQ